ncbi:hypothetical protein [Methylobacterium sp. CM6246]
MIYNTSIAGAYLQHPYLSKAAEAQVTLRHDAVCANLWIAPPPGSPQLHTDPHKAAFWSKKLVEVRSERFRRSNAVGLYKGSPEAFIGFDEVQLLLNAELDTKVVGAVQTLVLPTSPFLVRFTEAKYVKDALEHGRFRIAPAGGYNDPSLNAAQKDDELSHAAVRGDRRIVMQINGYLPGEDPSQARPMPVNWGEMFQYMNSANFYVLCLTDQFDARMFKDFDKDAAIIIRDPVSFLRRLSAATASNFPQLQFKAGPVKYYDPYTVERQELEPGFSKNFSFSYQSEFRPTWWPCDPETQLSAFFIEIGDLTDIAEAVYVKY